MTRRSPVPIEGITHGLSPTGKPTGYRQGCGCPECLQAKRHYEADRTAAARTPANGRPRQITARIVPVAAMVSPQVHDVLDQLAGPGGVSRWVNEAILEKLERDTGYRDTGRRRTPRSPNRQPRTKTTKGNVAPS